MKTSPLLWIASLLLITACSSTPKQSLTDGSAQAATNQAASQWYCEGDNNKQWKCRDLSRASEEPAEEAATTAEAVLATSAATPAIAETISEPSSPPVTAATSPTVVEKPYANDNYVVQLIAAREAVTIERFKQQNPQVTAKPLTVEKDGEQWLVLILGTYATYAEAQAAVAEIAPPLANPPWIRPIAPLRDTLTIQQ